MSATISIGRWAIKKAARTIVAATSFPRRPHSAVPSLRVLTYHRFGDATRDPFCVSERDFEKQMSYLANNNLAISLQEVEGFLQGRRNISPESILVTIDDGFHSVYSAARPILAHYGIPAVAFITPGLISQQHSPSPQKDVPEPFLTWEEARRLHDCGVAIGSHSLTHRSLTRIPKNQAREEIFRSRELLHRELGERITAFAYPFGTRADFNAETASLIKAAGYTCAFTSQHGHIVGSSDTFTLPRVKVEGGEDPWLFQRIVHGGLDAWQWVDKALWRVQASRDF